VAPVPLHTLREDRITPQPYQMRNPPGIRLPGRLDELLLKIGIAIALLIPIGYLLYHISVPPPPGPPVQQLLAQELTKFECADLAGRIGPDNVAAVTGFVQKPEDVSRVRTAVEGIRGIKRVSADVKVRIWPYCEVVAILKPYKQRNDESKLGLGIFPTAGHDDRFVEGERVIVELRQPAYDGYLYVDYYVIDGTVVHMFPNTKEPESGKLFKSGARPRVGEKIEQPWLIGPPFGQELITVIASPVPLYQGTRDEAEPAAQYLPRLREMVEANSHDTRFASNFLFLQTHPK
jgi:hypothetical protein